MKRSFVAGVIGASLLVLACGGGGEPSHGDTAAPPAAAPAAGSGGGALTPAPGGKIVEVEMITDETGNFFKPADFEVKKGDVIRFKLGMGVHNAHFVADSNPGASNLPPAGPLLQLPGQTYDVLADWEPGRLFYQCDPHALLGMVGHVTVTP